MGETAAQKKKREAQEAAAKKAQEEKAAAAAAKTQSKAQDTNDLDLLKKAQEDAVKSEASTRDEKEKQGREAIEEAKKNDKKADEDYVLSTTHDDVVRKKLELASSSAVDRQLAEQYRIQQETQKALETATQRGLGFAGVRKDDE